MAFIWPSSVPPPSKLFSATTLSVAKLAAGAVFPVHHQQVTTFFPDAFR